MSHVTEVKLKLRDLDAVEDAARACGLELVRDQTKFQWYGTFVGDTTPPAGRDPKDYGKCDHALRVKGSPKGDYEIGLVKALDGDGYEAMYDSWGNGANLERVCGGRGLPRLKREYAAAVATRKAASKFRVQREDLPGGRIRLKLRKR